jgi:hypothetical protein
MLNSFKAGKKSKADCLTARQYWTLVPNNQRQVSFCKYRLCKTQERTRISRACLELEEAAQSGASAVLKERMS